MGFLVGLFRWVFRKTNRVKVLLRQSKVGSRQGSKFFLEAGSANRYDAEFPARFYFAPIAFLASVRWAALPPFALSRARSRNRLQWQAKHPFFHMRVISLRIFSLSLMPLKIELYH
ncbi:hypothetical protein MRB53_036298 [Persea americana]|nr:hypothetical protein MRB53_036476 [Persea americana]KAJ8614885.1 hypothetical protein MRB53_036298 [Persea americana]